MTATTRGATAAMFTTFALSWSPLAAQEVLLSEVRADADGRWVELHNRSGVTIDLSSWSLHYATHTTGMPKNYWWAFPLGTTLAPDGYLRVHWFQAQPANAQPGDLWTGNTVWDFLFGLGGEQLRADAGAFGLFRTQLDSMMATPAMVEDWVGWGGSGYQREWMAIANGRWSAGQAVASVTTGSSIARNVAALAAGTPPELQWFADASPTPLAPNLDGASVTAYGAGCAPNGHHLLGVPVLRAAGLPLRGNAQFALQLDRTTGIFGEYVFVVWGRGAAPAGQPAFLPSVPGGCAESIDPWRTFDGWLLPAQVMTTTVALPLQNMPVELVGSELHAQALVFDFVVGTPAYQGLSNALQIVFGQ